MQDIARDNRVLSLVGRAGLRSQLVQMLDQLQRCQKSLNEFLEVKQAFFSGSFLEPAVLLLKVSLSTGKFTEIVGKFSYVCMVACFDCFILLSSVVIHKDDAFKRI